MIGRLSGTLAEKAPPQVLIDVNGVGYEVDVPMSSFYNLPALGERVTLLTHFVVREDAQLLYGFLTAEERATFRQLINRRYPDLKIEHFHHAGNSSGVVDGAAALLLASADYARKHGLAPRARVIATANMGDDPTLMLNAPAPAAKKVLARAGLSADDIDLWEVNEAFAVVAEKFIRDMKLDREKVNVNGGAIALGHPIGATGAVLIGTVLDELERRGLKRGLVTMCAAGGMAPAIIIERV